MSRTLDRLRDLAIPPSTEFELLVVDNASSDDTRAVVLDFAAGAHFRTRYVLETVKGLSQARNRGLGESSGELILFTDDDCLVDENWISNAVSLFSGDMVKVVGGRVDLHNRDHLPHSIKESPVAETLSSCSLVLGFIHGANMAFGREVVRRIGVFDVRFGAGTGLQSAEDSEYVYRACRNGIPVLYDPSLRVSHDHGRSGAGDHFAIMRGYSVGLGAVLMKYAVKGDFGLVRTAYWDLKSALRGWRADRRQWRWPLSRIGFVIGAARFLARRGSGSAS